MRPSEREGIRGLLRSCQKRRRKRSQLELHPLSRKPCVSSRWDHEKHANDLDTKTEEPGQLLVSQSNGDPGRDDVHTVRELGGILELRKAPAVIQITTSAPWGIPRRAVLRVSNPRPLMIKVENYKKEESASISLSSRRKGEKDRAHVGNPSVRDVSDESEKEKEVLWGKKGREE